MPPSCAASRARTSRQMEAKRGLPWPVLHQCSNGGLVADGSLVQPTAMTIENCDQDKLMEVLGRRLTPSAHITTPERLFGRQQRLTQIERAFNSPGRHVFIFGDRGVGKTSLALTAAYLHQDTSEEPVYVLCSESSTFGKILHSVGINALPLKERMESTGAPSKISGGIPGIASGSYSAASKPVANFGEPADINDATNIIRYINSRRNGTTVVVIDELERIKDPNEKMKIAEFVNSISSVQDETKFILSGIGSTVEELLGNHPSASRKLEAIELAPIPHDELWNIILSVADELSVAVEKEHLIRSSILSDGFPHYVHLIAENLFWSMYDDIEECRRAETRHFKEAVKGALERTDVEHKSAYRIATQKTKNTLGYELALWSLADKTETQRQITSIYEDSYRRIARDNLELDVLDKNALNHRLLNLREESHGRIIVGYGSGWFRFRENIMRGYVRLVAESRGVSLARDLAA